MVTNSTLGTSINVEVIDLKSLKEKTFGAIIFSKKALILNTRFGIHTFFVKNPLDIIILDNRNRVKIIKNLKPNRIFVWNPKFPKVLELPDGSADNLKLNIGHILKFDL